MRKSNCVIFFIFIILDPDNFIEGNIDFNNNNSFCLELGAVFSDNSPANHAWIDADFSQKVSWVREKLPDRNVTNFAKDWRDGLLMRELVNSTQPGLIPPKP